MEEGMKLTVVGSGHVGLVAGLCFAEIGHDVVCLDSVEEKVAGLAQGRLPFYEPELQGLLERTRALGRVRFTTDLPAAVRHGEVLFLAVGTPPLPGGEADLSAVEQVCREIAAHADGDKLVVEKSTVPVGTGERIEQTLGLSGRGGVRFDVASNPEFLSEGRAVVDFLVPDRIVIGVENARAERLLRSIYEPIVNASFAWKLETPPPARRSDVPLLVTNRNSAELIKHASNSFLATKISYINAVAELCERIGADIEKVAEGMGYDRRIGKDFLRAGIGFGGFCFPKDLQAFVHIAEQQGCDFGLLAEVEKINLRRVDLFVEKCRDRLWILKDKTLAAWGLSFKADTDDVRYSPAVGVVQSLLAEGARIQAYDPQAMDESRPLLPKVDFRSSALEAAEGADAVLVLTDWPEFAQVNLADLRSRLARPLILDGRNLLDPEKLRREGFEYEAMGRASAARVADETEPADREHAICGS